MIWHEISEIAKFMPRLSNKIKKKISFNRFFQLALWWLLTAFVLYKISLNYVDFFTTCLIQDWCFISLFIKAERFSSSLCRLLDHDRRLVLWVCLWGGRRQEVSSPRCPRSDATGAYHTSCLGSNGIIGLNTYKSIFLPNLTPPQSLAAFIPNISPAPPSETACSFRKIIKDFVVFFTGLLVSICLLYFYHLVYFQIMQNHCSFFSCCWI